MPPDLSVRGLTVAYGRAIAARNVSLELPTGGMAAMVGANGAGKTSVLSALAGLVRPRAGTIRFRGHDITRWPAHRRVAAGLILVPEGRQILATLTVAENLQLGARRGRRALAKSAMALDSDRRPAPSLEELYDMFPVLAERRRLPAGSLSGGEQQMLAIARAMAGRPEVLLLDEPSMGLAPRMVDEVFTVIETIRGNGVPIILVEQNARRALCTADTGYVLQSGELVYSGPAHALLEDPRVVRAYLGTD